MIYYEVTPGTTDVTLNIFIPDASSSVGAGLTGLVFNSSGLVCYYAREKAAAAALSLATQTVTGAHSDGGFVEIDATNMPGVYRLDLSDAVCAVNVTKAMVILKGAANMVPVLINIKLDNTNQTGDSYPLVSTEVAEIYAAVITNAAGTDIAADIIAVKADTAAILTDTGTTLEADLDAIIAAVITNAACVDIAADIIAVKADTAAILTDTGTTLEADLDAIIAAVITNAAGVDIAADIIAVKADTAAILTDTNELQTDDYPTSIAAVKADTAAILTDTGTTLEADLDAIIAAVITNAAGVDIAADIIAVKADTAAILTDTGTTLEADLDAIIAAVITNAAGVDIAADIIAVKADTAAILTDTNELQTDDYPTSIAAVKADTAAVLADTGTDGVVVAAASKTGYTLTSGEHTNIADALLKRDWTAVTGEAARSVLNALRWLRNKWSISGTTMTVTKEDDSTSAWTAELGTTAGADPVTSSDPS